MTETPKCPYCGAEMLDDSYTWTCPKCYSNSPVVIWDEEKVKGMTEEEKMAYAREAALHRAEPEMRPLTLEELKAYCAKGPDAEPLYIEFSHRTTLSRWILVAPNIECNEPATVTRYLDIWEQDYGKTWRCWHWKPTPEQMAAAKWEE